VQRFLSDYSSVELSQIQRLIIQQNQKVDIKLPSDRRNKMVKRLYGPDNSRISIEARYSRHDKLNFSLTVQRAENL